MKFHFPLSQFRVLLDHLSVQVKSNRIVSKIKIFIQFNLHSIRFDISKNFWFDKEIQFDFDSIWQPWLPRLLGRPPEKQEASSVNSWTSKSSTSVTPNMYSKSNFSRLLNLMSTLHKYNLIPFQVVTHLHELVHVRPPSFHLLHPSNPAGQGMEQSREVREDLGHVELDQAVRDRVYQLLEFWIVLWNLLVWLSAWRNIVEKKKKKNQQPFSPWMILFWIWSIDSLAISHQMTLVAATVKALSISTRLAQPFPSSGGQMLSPSCFTSSMINPSIDALPKPKSRRFRRQNLLWTLQLWPFAKRMPKIDRSASNKSIHNPLRDYHHCNQ